MLPAGHREVWQSLKPLRDRGLGVHLGKARFRSVLPKVFCFATRTCCSRPVEGCWKSTFAWSWPTICPQSPDSLKRPGSI